MTSGRPRASSRETLAEAACELFLERGYESTTVADIAARAGVSRSSFFNYFASKSEILWAGLDERIAEAEAGLAAGADVRAALARIGDRFTPDSLALALVNAGAMGLDDELARESAGRRARIARAVARALEAAGAGRLVAEVAGAAHGGAVLSAVEVWAHQGAGVAPLGALLEASLEAAAPTLPGAVRQLRLVARADHFDGAVRFYRDVLGMRELESYQGAGDARVMILDAGRATLELSNAAQIDLIDRVETDGDAPSESIRVGLEVGDVVEATAAAVTAGALLEAAPRETPWRSLNARVRAPAGLQVTFFQQLGDARAD
jgi:AcrR family transcriptional regulator